MKNISKEKIEKKLRRAARIRVKIIGTKEKPRLSVFKSLKDTYAQLIDDGAGNTVISANTKEIIGNKLNKTKKAYELGKLVAKKALENNIKSVVFDRAGNKFQGRVKAVADGAREGGLKI